jgi:hypothetical protein
MRPLKRWLPRKRRQHSKPACQASHPARDHRAGVTPLSEHCARLDTAAFLVVATDLNKSIPSARSQHLAQQ